MSTVPSHTQLTKFASLFAGRDDARGALHGQFIQEKITLDHYRRHLGGKISLGVYMLLPNGKVKWFAIDIDSLDVRPALAVYGALKSLGIVQGLYIERSRAKGFHVLVFSSDFVPARAARVIAKVTLQQAGLPPTTEIFPKQDELTTKTPWGNYLNLPYFAGGNPEGRRMVFNPETLKPVPLEQWLDEVTTFPADQLTAIASRLGLKSEDQGIIAEAKPKARQIVSERHTAGTRRPSLVSLAGYLRNRRVEEDVAVELLVAWAREHCEPPLPDSEIEKHVRGIYRRYGLPPASARRSSSKKLATIEVGR